jgi:hypothetical protein
MAISTRAPRPIGIAPRTLRSLTADSHVAAFIITIVVLWACLLTTDSLRHWFIIPVSICALLILPDLIDWLTGRVDVFDPGGLVAVFGVVHFFAAPILHVLWDRWPLYLPFQPNDWRPWLGLMGALNAVGLLIYRFVRARAARPRRRKAKERVWIVNPRTFSPALIVALLASLAASAWLFLQLGGISGYIGAYSAETLSPFEGLGLVSLVSDALSILVLMGWVVRSERRGTGRAWWQIALVLLVVLVLRVIFGGFRGSRNNVIWGLFWGVGMIHFWRRRIPRALVYGGIVFIFLFAYLFAFYKGVGPQAFSAVTNSSSRAQLVTQTQYDSKTVLLLDLGRSAIQAYLAYRVEEGHSDYQIAWGRTYLGAVAGSIPQAIWPGRPPSKVKEATEAIYGRGTYVPGHIGATYVYGIAGEGLLNFGLVAVPLSFAALGFAVGRVRRTMKRLHRRDARWLLVPLLALLCPVILTLDSDNVVIFLLQNGTLPLAVLLVGTVRIRRSALEQAPHTAEEPG